MASFKVIRSWDKVIRSWDGVWGKGGNTAASFDQTFRLDEMRALTTTSTGERTCPRAAAGRSASTLGRHAAARLPLNVALGVALSLGATPLPATAFGFAADDQDAEAFGPHASDAILEADNAPAHSERRKTMLNVADAELLAQLTGPGSLNDTGARWGVHGTDLGHMFWHRDRLYMVFGDTFGEGGLGGKNWRSNALARLADADPRQGLRIESMITGPDGNAKELIPSRKVDGVEKTVIPTHGISINGRMYLHYMSVSRWGGGTSQWKVRHSGIAYSDDDGHTWNVPEKAIWSAPTGFEQVALVHKDGRVYMFGIPGGRFGGVRLRRVAADRLLDRRAYEYWDGERWVAEPDAATIVVPSPVGELSVAWNALHQRWLMMYLNVQRGAVVLRMAPTLTGPWGDEQIVVRGKRDRNVYAPYIVPFRDLGNDIYFTLSIWQPYNVFLMRMRLEAQPRGLMADGDDTP